MSDSIPISRPITSTNIPTEKLAGITYPTEKKATFPTEFIDLPSEGYFYSLESPLSSGRLELKFMTAKEEDILTSQNLIKKGIVLDELLKALIVNPTISLDDILVGDKNAIYIAARRLAYGDDYSVKIQCPACKAEVDETINLSHLKNKSFDFSSYKKGENIFDFILPVSKKTVQYKLMTHKDEQNIDVELKAIAKLSKTGVAPEITTRIKYMLISVDGNSDRSYIKKFVDTELLSRDSYAIRDHIRKNSPDIDLSFEFKCSSCGHTEVLPIQISANFFWPDAGT